MPESKKKCFKILQIELEDLIDDISILIGTHEARRNRGEITDYVYKENVALLVNEKTAIGHFLKELVTLDLEGYKDVHELVAGIEKKFNDFLMEHSYSQALESFVKKKLQKVVDYCLC